MPSTKMGSLFSCFSSKKENITEKSENTTEKSENTTRDPTIHKKARQYDEVDIVDEPEKKQEGTEPTKTEPALNYVEVDIKPASGATTTIVGSDQPKTQYSTIDIEATEQRRLSSKNTEET